MAGATVIQIGQPGGNKSTDLATLIDEYGALDQAIEAMKPHVARHKALREQILANLVEVKPDQGFQLSTANYVFTATAQENQRRIVSMAKVKKRLGLPNFLALCSFTLKALDAHVTTIEQQQLGLVVAERTGPRDVKVTPRQQPQAVPPAA